MGKKKPHRKKQKIAPVKSKRPFRSAVPKRNMALTVILIVLFLVLFVALSLIAHYLSMFSVKDVNQ